MTSRCSARWVLVMVITATLSSCGSTTADSTSPPITGTTSPPGTAAPKGRPSPGCASTSATADPNTQQAIKVDGTDRTYLIATPASPPSSTAPAPLVILLHGMGSNGADINRVSDLPKRGTAAGVIVASPNAVGSPTIWRAGGTGPDAALLDAMITDIEAHQCVDTTRVAIAGFSVGAVLAAAYACTHQDRISAIVTVEVDAPGPCTKPMPILAFHGTADPIVPYAPPPGSPALGGGTGTESNLAKWATFSNCADTPQTTEVGSEVTKLEWPRCSAGSEVVLYKIIGGQHDWPGKDPATAVHPSTQQVSATDEAVAFVRRHALPAT